MIKKFVVMILFFSLSNSWLSANTDSFLAATHPKGGTGLLVKTLQMIAGEKPAKLFCHYDGRRYSPQMLDTYLKEGGLPVIHLYSPHFTYHYLLNHHLDAKVIIIIRDIRDAFVSYAYYFNQDPNSPLRRKLHMLSMIEDIVR